MKISEYAVKNSQFTFIMVLMAIVLGITALFNMPRSEDPDIHMPLFPVIVIYPGTSPQDMEQLVIKPLEDKLYALENVKKLQSNISDGLAVIQVEFTYGSDYDSKYQELVREVNGMRSTLPQDIYSLEVRKVSPSDVNVLQVALISENASFSTIKKYSDKLEDELEKVPELKNVEVSGLPDRIVRVDLRLEKLAQMNIPMNYVLQSLQSEQANIPGGSVEAGTQSFSVKTSGNFTNIDEIKNTVVFTNGGQIIRLSDIADVHYDYQEAVHTTRLNGHRSVLVTAAQKEGFNIAKTQQKYKPVIENFRKTLPSNIDLIQSFDQGDNVNNRLAGLGEDFIFALLLVLFTLLPLGYRASIVVMISIPLSLGIALVLLNAFGYTLNQLSIVGLVVSLGLLVDDSIVVVENIERWILEGYTRLEATMKATTQIGKAVIGCTAMLIISFLPLAFLPAESGDFIRSMPISVMFSVLASMIVALTVVPFLCSRILADQHHGKHGSEGNLFHRLLKKFISGSYGRLLDDALLHPIKTIIIAVVIFGASLAIIPVIGFSLFPESEKPQFLINITTPLQTNLTQTNEVSRYVEQELSKLPEVKYYTTNVGKSNPRIYYNTPEQNQRSDYAQIFVQLKETTTVPVKMEIIEKLRKSFNAFPSAKIEVKNFEQGPPVVAPVEVRIMGDDLDSLKILAGRVENMLKKTEGTMYVRNPVSNLKTDLRVAINLDKARMLGINTIDVDRTVRLAVAGFTLGTYTEKNGDEYDVLVTSPKEERATMASFQNLYVNNALGTAVPIRQIADLKFETAQPVIDRLNKSRMVPVSAFVKKGYLNNVVIDDVIRQLDNIKLPAGYTYMMGGEVESKSKSFDGLGTIILITIFLFFAVLILLFKTFKSTLIVLSVIPLGIVGAVLALWITGNSMSFVAIIGLIALAGIEVKNTILLVDFTNQLREEGKSLQDAIREAGEVRFFPIILTSLTAIGGLIPIAISSNPLISPLAIVLIGGLISSTLLSRLVTPVIYLLIPPAISTGEPRKID